MPAVIAFVKLHKAKFLIGFVAFAVVCLASAAGILLARISSKSNGVAPQQILATPTAFRETSVSSFATAAPAPTFTPSPVLTPSESAEWKVDAVLEPVTENDYRYAIVVFRNVGKPSLTKTGKCQQPGWPIPEVGHVYKLVETSPNYWLFIPIEGVDSDFQRFLPIE